MDNYYIFVLGYDLLRDRIIRRGATECDYAYDICKNTYEAFLASGYNDDMSRSDYENLERFINENKFDWEGWSDE